MKRLTPLKASRARCIECSGFQLKDVRECVFDGKDEELCPLYHLRMGKGDRKILKAIRSFCLSCCTGQKDEVKLCPSIGCSLWIYRFGKRPRNTSNLSEITATEGISEPIPIGGV